LTHANVPGDSKNDLQDGTAIDQTAPRGKDWTSWSYGLGDAPRAPAIGPSVLLASLAINLLSLALPLVILQVYDRILPNAATETLLILVLGLCVVLLLDAGLRTARSYILGWHAAKFEHLSGCTAVDRLLSADVGSFERSAPGVHLDRLGAIDSLRDFNAGQARLLVADVPFIGLFLALMWLIAGPLVLVPIGMLCLLMAAASLLGQRLKAALRQRAELDDRRYNFIIEVLGSMFTVKCLAMERLMQRRYERLQQNGAVGTYRTTFLSNLAQGLGAVFSNLTMVSVAAVGATYVIDGQLSVGALAACTLLSGRAVQPLLRALGLWTQLQNVQLARQRYESLFALQPEARPEARRLGPIQGAIELKGVSFRYAEGEPLLFDGIDLEIAAGETVGISGGTGSGKSTLLMLIAKALSPTAGAVLVDGRDIADADPFTLRRQIAYLPQNAVLFRGTILDNLTLFRGREGLEEALQAAQLLSLDQLIHRLPAGYETRVGDGANEELPNGTRQGIALARALAGKPRVILFDEANSSLDSRNDARLKDALQSLKGGATMILVSHRPSVLALADRVYDLSDGRLVLRPKAEPEAAGESSAAAEALKHVTVQPIVDPAAPMAAPMAAPLAAPARAAP